MVGPLAVGAFRSTLPIMVIVALRAQRFRSSVRFLRHIFQLHPILQETSSSTSMPTLGNVGYSFPDQFPSPLSFIIQFLSS
nr:hypothetical protein [Tanacetum cinerariifolium]